MSAGGPTADEPADGEGIPLLPMLGLLGLLVTIAAGVTAWSWHVGRERLPPERAWTAPLPEQVSGVECGPIDQAHAARDRRRDQVHQLSAYAWVPGEPGIACIPIDVAMQVWLEREARR